MISLSLSSPLQTGGAYVLVFDLGGGTLDVSILTIDSGIFEGQKGIQLFCSTHYSLSSSRCLGRPPGLPLCLFLSAVSSPNPDCNLFVIQLFWQVISTNGDTHLGGEDFDTLIVR
ncbi:hypothetical protein T492DRAFT_840132 [Pavlovales sp. CCMP2436]|nr:hypothetical protein T492DRAFT_840132 [Pavlovales sp. CCMP2436]